MAAFSEKENLAHVRKKVAHACYGGYPPGTNARKTQKEIK